MPLSRGEVAVPVDAAGGTVAGEEEAEGDGADPLFAGAGVDVVGVCVTGVDAGVDALGTGGKTGAGAEETVSGRMSWGGREVVVDAANPPVVAGKEADGGVCGVDPPPHPLSDTAKVKNAAAKTPSAALRRGGVAGASSDPPLRFAHDKTRSKTSAEAWPVRHVDPVERAHNPRPDFWQCFRRSG